MERVERQRRFREAVKSSPLVANSSNWKLAQGTGISNSPTVVELGLEVLDADLASVDLSNIEEIEGFAFWGSIWVPPGVELYIAVYIQSNVAGFLNRLRTMIDSGEQEARDGVSTPRNATRNNNVAVLAHRENKKLYLRNKGHWTEAEDTDELENYHPGLTVDRVDYAIYGREGSAYQNLSVGAFIGYLSSLFPAGIVHEISPWPDVVAVDEKFRKDPSSLSAEEVFEAISNLGGHYEKSVVSNFHIALNHLSNKHFVILSGISGLGKTSLLIRYAQAVHEIDNPDDKDPFLYLCAVRPDWTDPTGLIGYYDIILSRYVVPPFLQALLTALAHPDVHVFVCIDEMNIARVEYYFADILSAIESGQNIHLHNNPRAYEGTNSEDIPPAVPMPSNLYIVGTINVDETTFQISDKVYDRANLISLDTVDIDGYLDSLVRRESNLEEAATAVKELLVRLIEILQPESLAFGYRTVEEITRYITYAKKIAGEDEDVIPKVLDAQLVQKILVKIRGSEHQRIMLEQLAKAVSSYPYSLKRVKDMTAELNEFGAF